MLRSLRERVRIVLGKDRLVILQLQGGSPARIVSKQTYLCENTESGWEPLLALLETVLKGRQWNKADAMIILSNHFAHFIDLPGSESQLNDKEKMSLVQLRFAEVYGDASTSWAFRLSEGSSFGSVSLASAIPQELLSRLISIFESSHLSLRSVQPFLMTAFNVCRREIGDREGWFMLVERDTFCIGLLRGGQWSRIRLRHVVTDWFEEAILMLEREAMLAGGGDQLKNVFLCAPEIYGPESIKRGQWSIKRIKSEIHPAISTSEKADYAMAAVGL